MDTNRNGQRATDDVRYEGHAVHRSSSVVRHPSMIGAQTGPLSATERLAAANATNPNLVTTGNLQVPSGASTGGDAPARLDSASVPDHNPFVVREIRALRNTYM